MNIFYFVVPKEKKRREKKYQKRTVQALLSQEELMETATFKRFSNAIDYLFEGVDEADLTLDMGMLFLLFFNNHSVLIGTYYNVLQLSYLAIDFDTLFLTSIYGISS